MHEKSVLPKMLLFLAIFTIGFLTGPVEAEAYLKGTYTKYDLINHLIEIKVNLTSSVPIREVTLQYYYANVTGTPANVSMKFLAQGILDGFNSTLWGVEILAPATANITLVSKIYVIDSLSVMTEIKPSIESMWTSQRSESMISLTPFAILSAITIATLIIIGLVLIRSFCHIRKEKEGTIRV
jgi:hypothetical protein